MKSVYSAVRTGALNKAVCATVQNVVATAIWRPVFVHSWPYILVPA